MISFIGWAIDWVSGITTVIFLITLIWGIYAWIAGILPALIRLGNGLSRRKIAIFAKGDHLRGLEDLLLDSKLFKQKNVIGIASEGDIERAERATIFLIFWHDWQDHITKILHAKKENTALVVYAPQELGRIPDDKLKEINGKKNAIVVNFRGRLLNDIIISLMSTSYH